MPQSMLEYVGDQLLNKHVVLHFDEEASDVEMCVFYKQNPDKKTLKITETLKEVRGEFNKDAT